MPFDYTEETAHDEKRRGSDVRTLTPSVNRRVKKEVVQAIHTVGN